jgi:hypothetical protein
VQLRVHTCKRRVSLALLGTRHLPPCLASVLQSAPQTHARSPCYCWCWCWPQLRDVLQVLWQRGLISIVHTRRGSSCSRRRRAACARPPCSTAACCERIVLCV